MRRFKRQGEVLAANTYQRITQCVSAFGSYGFNQALKPINWRGSSVQTPRKFFIECLILENIRIPFYISVSCSRCFQRFPKQKCSLYIVVSISDVNEKLLYICSIYWLIASYAEQTTWTTFDFIIYLSYDVLNTSPSKNHFLSEYLGCLQHSIIKTARPPLACNSIEIRRIILRLKHVDW